MARRVDGAVDDVMRFVVPRGHDWTRGSPPGAPEPAATYWRVDAEAAGRAAPAGAAIVEIEIQ